MVITLLLSFSEKCMNGLCNVLLYLIADELGGPPDKPLPREPSICTQPSTSPPPTNSTSIANKLHEQNSDGAVSSADIVNDSESSFHTVSPPSSPDA